MAKFSIAGTTIKTGASGGAPSTSLGQVISGSAEFGTRNLVDTTTQTDETDTNTPGTKSPLTFTAVVQFDGSTAPHAAAFTAWDAGTVISAGVFFRDGAAAGNKPSIYSDGCWTQISMPFEVNGRMQASFTFSGSGDPTPAAV